jgi:hypothetical protein
MNENFAVSATGVPGVVRVCTVVPLDDPEINHRHLVRDLSQREALHMAMRLLATAGIDYTIELGEGS